MSKPTNDQIKAAAIVLMDSLRQEFMRRHPNRQPMTMRLIEYPPADAAVILRATKRMLIAAKSATTS
jgi:hypothetical protein